MEAQPRPRDAAYWASAVSRLKVGEIPNGALNLNVEGRRLIGPMQGFGKLWQKTYRINLASAAQPAEVVSAWKQHYGSFWPTGQRFYTSLAGIAPGEIGLISGAHGPVRMSTGVFVMYADDESFTFMNSQGHPWSGWITFSSYKEREDTVAQVHLLVRTSDPVYELGFSLMGGTKHEDEIWQHTLQSLAGHFGVEAAVASEVVCVDGKRQWSNGLRNLWHNALIRTSLYVLGAPVRGITGLFRSN